MHWQAVILDWTLGNVVGEIEKVYGDIGHMVVDIDSVDWKSDCARRKASKWMGIPGVQIGTWRTWIGKSTTWIGMSASALVNGDLDGGSREIVLAAYRVGLYID